MTEYIQIGSSDKKTPIVVNIYVVIAGNNYWQPLISFLILLQVFEMPVY
jgi:hypothetical protein